MTGFIINLFLGLFGIVLSFFVKNDPSGGIVKKHLRQVLFFAGVAMILLEFFW